MTSISAIRQSAPNTTSYGDPTHEYVDVVLCNNNFSIMAPQPVVFNQSKISNIVDKCNDYYFSIIRWNIESTVPVIIPDMFLENPNTPSAYDGSTNYIVNIGYGIGSSGNPGLYNAPTPTLSDISTIKQIVFQPRNKYYNINGTTQFPTNKPTSLSEVMNNPFYWLYSVDDFLEMVNQSLSESFALVKAANPIDLANALPPRFTWNAAEGKIDLLVTNEWIHNPTAGVKNLYIFMNSNLYNLLNTFPAVCFGNEGSNVVGFNRSNGYRDYALMLYSNYHKTTYSYSPNGNGTNAIPMNVYTQQQSSVPSWSPLQSVVFTSASIPVSASATGAPAFLGPDLSASNASNTQSVVLTDFNVPLTTGLEASQGSIIYYVPSSEYRLFDLVSNSQLQILNIQANWLDKYGFSHQFLIPYGCSASMKILLRKKTFNGI